MVFNEIKRSSHGKGSNVFIDILNYEGELCYIPTVNACFRKSLENLYRSYFSNEYKEFILKSDRRKNFMTLAKV